MMEKPCGQSKAADAAWREYEDKERKKRRYAEGRMRACPPSSVLDKKRKKLSRKKITFQTDENEKMIHEKEAPVV